MARRERVLGEDHRQTLMTLNNLGTFYHSLKNYKKAMEYYERDLKESSKKLGQNHPSTLMTLENIAIVYYELKEYGKAEELYQRTLEGYEAQFGKDHERTKDCAKKFKICLEISGNDEEILKELRKAYPWLNES